MAELKLRPPTRRHGALLQAANRRVSKAKLCATQLNMIDRGIDRKVRLLMDQQWLGRREAVEILPEDDPGVTENSEKENV